MKCWRVRAEPRRCLALEAVTAAAFGSGLLVPWLSGVPAPAAVALAVCALAGAVAARGMLPGPRARVRRLECGRRGWVVHLADGRSVPARILPGTRVLPKVVFCRLAVGKRRLGLALPAYAVPETDFRRLKGALRASAGGAAC